MKQAKANNRN